MPKKQPLCKWCNAPYDRKRLKVMGYRHCTDASCVAAFRRERNDEVGLKLVLMPKQALTWTIDDRDLLNGKSSGR